MSIWEKYKKCCWLIPKQCFLINNKLKRAIIPKYYFPQTWNFRGKLPTIYNINHIKLVEKKPMSKQEFLSLINMMIRLTINHGLY